MVAYQWEAATAAWVGWVPTVSGHLSFSLIGSDTSAEQPLIINGDKTGLGGRVVAVRQRRRNRDFGYWSWIAAKFLKDTVQDYVLVAHTEEGSRPERDPVSRAFVPIADARGVLRGTIFWFPYRRDDDLRTELETTLSELDAEQHRIYRLHGKAGEAAFDQVEGNFRSKLMALAADVPVHQQDSAEVVLQQLAYQFEFALYRTGEFRLWYVRDEGDLDELDHIAKQIFYFAKDIGHTHSHHGAESDQIVHLARIRPGRYPMPTQCETAWRNETQWGLSRVFEQLHRSSGVGAQRRALGVLAYADAFQGSLAQVMRVPGGGEVFEPDPNVALYDNQHRRESARAMIDYRTFRVGEKGQILLLVITALLASAGLWYGFTSIREVLCKQATANCMDLQAVTAAHVVSLIINSPITFFALCSFAVYIIFNIFIKDWDDVPILRRPQSGFLRMTFAILSRLVKNSNNPGRNLVGLVMALISFMLAAVFYMLYLLLVNQTQIRSLANEISLIDILQALP